MCSNCKECVYDRMCGSKEKYQQMINEYNKLNEKWDIFESNPPCPEFKDIDKFAEENGYSKCTSKIENTKDGHLSFEIKSIEEYKPTFKNSCVGGLDKDKEKPNEFFKGYRPKYYFKTNCNSTITNKDLEKIFQECGLNPIIIGDSSFIKEAKRVNEDLENKCQKAYEKLFRCV